MTSEMRRAYEASRVQGVTNGEQGADGPRFERRRRLSGDRDRGDAGGEEGSTLSRTDRALMQQEQD